jgi:NADPH-dependent glutamate synthase beta subunit-like oxidoreductase
VFCAGDMKSGASLVVRSIRQGREAAESINTYLAMR